MTKLDCLNFMPKFSYPQKSVEKRSGSPLTGEFWNNLTLKPQVHGW